jgi:hypothetical protein
MLGRALDRRRLLAGAVGTALVGARPPAAASAELEPFNGRFWGWPYPADATRSARWMRGRRLSVRLRADRTGTVTGLVWNMRVAQGSEREGRYSAGDGGYVHIELRSTHRDGYPERDWPDLGPLGLLARTAPNNGREAALEDLVPDGGSSWQHWPLNRPVEVRAGEIYHAVFVPHEARAWSAINCLGQDSPPPLGSGGYGGPWFGDDFVVMRETDADSELFEVLTNPDGPTVGLLFLRYTDGMLLGPAAGGTWRSARKVVGGRNLVRQTFTMPDRDRIADSVWIRVWALAEASSELAVELAAGADGADVLETVPVPLVRVPKGPPAPGSPPLPMIRVPFRRPQHLARGAAYQLRLGAPRRGFETIAGRQITEAEELDLAAVRDRIGPELTVAELSQDGGAAWQRWTVDSLSGGPRGDMALQAVFSLAG